MSDKIKSKDLSYDKSLPPFLQRLHDQNAGRGDNDRHEQPIARPRRIKDLNDDDGPTVVDESGETLTKDEYEQLTGINSRGQDLDAVGVKEQKEHSTGPVAPGGLPDDGSAAGLAPKRTERNVTDGTVQKKRKAAIMLGDYEEKADEGNDQDKCTKKATKRMKKKGKPVKLAFGDDDDDGGGG